MRTKSIEQSIADTREPEHELKKNLSALDLTVFGVGVVIGAGIFTITGEAASEYAGPAVVFSFLLAALGCALAALCYAEFASTVPVSGSAYTFSYASLGEIVAWIIGWDLLLEMALGASVVSQGWGQYAATLLKGLGVPVESSIHLGGLEVNWFAMILVAALTLLVMAGIKESMRVNLVLVGVKVFIVLFVIVAGIMLINTANYSPFIPPAAPPAEGNTAWYLQPLIQAMFGMDQSVYGVGGIFSAAALVFFAYIGFDVVATTAEEAKKPQRDLPIGIIASLLICTTLYCAVALVITGMMPYKEIDSEAALANAFVQHGKPVLGVIIAAGAVAGLTTVVMTLMIGASRVLFAMTRDRLLPPRLGVVHKTRRTPWLISLVVGLAVMLIAGLTPTGTLDEMVNIGTLSAFVLVSVGVIALRRSRPDLPRAFKVPFVPVVPILAALICTYLMLNLSVETWLRFLLWLALGIIIYFAYGYKRSKLHPDNQGADGEVTGAHPADGTD